MIDEIDDEPTAQEKARMRQNFTLRLAWLRRAVFMFGELSEWRLTADQAEETERVVLAALKPVTVVGR